MNGPAAHDKIDVVEGFYTLDVAVTDAVCFERDDRKRRRGTIAVHSLRQSCRRAVPTG